MQENSFVSLKIIIIVVIIVVINMDHCVNYRLSEFISASLRSLLPCPAPIQPALLHRSAPTVRGYQGAAYSISCRCCCCWSKTVHPTIEMDSFCYCCCCCCCIWYCRCYRSLLSCYNAMFTEVIIFVIQDYRSCRLGQRWYVHCPVLRPPRLYQVTRHEKEVSYGWAQYILVIF